GQLREIEASCRKLGHVGAFRHGGVFASYWRSGDSGPPEFCFFASCQCATRRRQRGDRVKHCKPYASFAAVHESGFGTKRTCQLCRSMSASLIGRLGSSAFRLSTNSSVDVAHGLSLLFGLGTKGPSIMGFEDEVEQSFGRPCRQCDGRFKRTY